MIILFGRFIGALICIFGQPIHALLSLLIKSSDPGPALYRSSRLGKNGVPFTLLKYRTMKVNAPPIVTTSFKKIVAETDPRVTRFGRWLRIGIDELPQIWNIVCGEMAWVGPRPDEAWMLPNYGPLSRRRLSLLPGITGFAQVLNSRNLSTAEAYALDLWYLEHRGFWLDSWIILVTPLFMGGWKTVGSNWLKHLHRSGELDDFFQICESELSSANIQKASPRTSASGSVEWENV